MRMHSMVLGSVLLLVGGCGIEVGGSSALLRCGASTDCPAGLECEVEHGSFTCQPHAGGADPASTSRGGACEVDADCGAGLECELEHGVVSCQPHRSEDGTVTGELTCATDADCGAGLECEIEHGASWCQPHGTLEEDELDGGARDGGIEGMTCLTDADCGAGLECEIEHGASWCQPHSSGGDDDGV